MNYKIKKNYDDIIIVIILTSHFLYLGNFSNLYFYEIYDHYLKTSNNFRDFFWYPSNALLNKINIFDTYLNEYNFRSYPPGYTPPNYSILHTLIFLPFGFLQFSVSVIFYLLLNLILLFFIYKKLKYKFQTYNKSIFLLFILFLFSPALILCLKIGQYTIFCLWGFLIYFTNNNNKLFFKFLGLLLATGKYTFAPIVGLYLLLQRKFKIFFLLITLNITAVLFYSIYFNISFQAAFVSPIIMGWNTQAIGAGDLLSFLGNHPKFPFNILIVLLLFFFIQLILYYNSKRSQILDFITVSILTSMSLKHLNYDYIFIFPVILLLFEKINFKFKIILSIIIFYYLFLLPWSIIEPIRYTKYFIFFNFMLNIVLLLITLKSIIVSKHMNKLYKRINQK